MALHLANLNTGAVAAGATGRGPIPRREILVNRVARRRVDDSAVAGTEGGDREEGREDANNELHRRYCRLVDPSGVRGATNPRQKNPRPAAATTAYEQTPVAGPDSVTAEGSSHAPCRAPCYYLP